jgi:hypothetical protein
MNDGTGKIQAHVEDIFERREVKDVITDVQGEQYFWCFIFFSERKSYALLNSKLIK